MLFLFSPSSSRCCYSPATCTATNYGLQLIGKLHSCVCVCNTNIAVPLWGLQSPLCEARSSGYGTWFGARRLGPTGAKVALCCLWGWALNCVGAWANMKPCRGVLLARRGAAAAAAASSPESRWTIGQGALLRAASLVLQRRQKRRHAQTALTPDPTCTTLSSVSGRSTASRCAPPVSRLPFGAWRAQGSKLCQPAS